MLLGSNPTLSANLQVTAVTGSFRRLPAWLAIRHRQADRARVMVA
jgi:hypothetical protein